MPSPLSRRAITAIGLLIAMGIGCLLGYVVRTPSSSSSGTASTSLGHVSIENTFINNGFFAARIQSDFRGADYEYRIEFVQVTSDGTLSVIEDHGSIWIGNDFNHEEFRLVGVINPPVDSHSYGSFSIAWGEGGGWAGLRPSFDIPNTDGFGRIMTEIVPSKDLAWVDNRIPLVLFSPELSDHSFGGGVFRLDLVRRDADD